MDLSRGLIIIRREIVAKNVGQLSHSLIGRVRCVGVIPSIPLWESFGLLGLKLARLEVIRCYCPLWIWRQQFKLPRSLSLNSLLSRLAGAGPKLSDEDGLD